MHTTTRQRLQHAKQAIGRAWPTLLVLCAALLATPAATLAAVPVKAARLGNTADAQRIVVELGAPVTFKYFTLGNPQRLVVDLEGIDPGAEALKQLAERVAGNDPYIAEIRVAQNRPGVTRLVAGLKQPMRPLVSLLPAVSGFGPRLVIDLIPGSAVSRVDATESLPTAAPQALGKPAAAPIAKPVGLAPSIVQKTETPAATRSPSVEARSSLPNPGDVTEGKKETAKAMPGKEVAEKPATSSLRPSGEPVASHEKPASTSGETAPTRPVALANTASENVGTEKPTEDKAAGKTAAPVADKVASVTPSEAQEKAQDKTQDKAKPATKPASLEKQVEQAIRQAERAGDNANPGKTTKKSADTYKRLVTVAIDAGHGGVDPGALGANGSREKDITLAVARRLKEHLDKKEGMRGVLTRDGDYFIPLHERVNRARRAQADLFVSIHADAFLKTTAKGSSVFALSEKGASSAAARWLAKRENDADLIGGVNLDVKDVYLKQTLLDLSQTATIADSLKLAKAVLDELGEINDLHKGKVEQAGFAVLKAPDMPSILVETAFISNPDEEKRLLDEEYQDRLAAAIVSGIRAYFDANPPLARAKVARAD